jgi:hypothetical protein
MNVLAILAKLAPSLHVESADLGLRNLDVAQAVLQDRVQSLRSPKVGERSRAPVLTLGQGDVALEG